MERNIRLGLNVPLFVASIISIATGTYTGMVGIWGYAVHGKFIPEWVKVGHAHIAWWSVLILLAAIVLPSLPLSSWFRKLAIAIAFISPSGWLILGQYAYYSLGLEFAIYLMPVFEIPLFLVLLAIALAAAGIKVPGIVTEGKPKPSKYDILSDVEIDRRVFLVPTLVAAFGVIAGFTLAAYFKQYHNPINPAALVQLHDHLILISASALIALLVLRVLNVAESVFKLATRIMMIALPLVALGLLAFNFLGLNSLVWVIPAGIYYILPIMAFLAALRVLPRAAGELPYTPALRASLAVVYAMILILVAQGANIALVWDTSPNVSVTFKQPEGVPYPGPYPEVFQGTVPYKDTPRGLENAHLSPGSWSHVAALWLVTLVALVGPKIFVEKLRKPGLMYMFMVTIPMAPFFNMLGRYLAWWGPPFVKAPAGIGALIYAGHPIKGFNIILLFILGVILLYMMSKEKKEEKV